MAPEYDSSDFRAILSGAIRDGTCLALVLSRAKRPDSAEKITVRPVNVRGAGLYQFASRSGGRETHENLAPDDAAGRVLELFGPVYADCHLFTVAADYSARSRRDGQIKLKTGPPSKRPEAISHNRAKNYLIAENVPCPFLTEIGVMTPAGKVRAARYSKFRQINRFLELVNDVVEFLPREGRLDVVDFGCGKSYLTFALHHLLTVIHGREVRLVGLDRNPDVIRDCTRIAEALGCRGLEFRPGDIAAFDPAGPVDLAVSLHACDTATDDALAKAVGWGAGVILAVPCCQHELAAKLPADRLPLLTQHGILKERFAALATDALRAQALEICGYRTQVVEFIEMEHTAKNVLIRAVRRESAGADSADKIEAYRNLKDLLGIDRMYLEEISPEFGILSGNPEFRMQNTESAM